MSQMSTPGVSSKKTVRAEEKPKSAKALVAKSGAGSKTGAETSISAALPVPVKESARGKSGGGKKSAVAAGDRHGMISMAAYFRAQQRGFRDGDQVADWLVSEAEIDAMLNA